MTSQFNIAGFTIRLTGHGSSLRMIRGFEVFKQDIDSSEALCEIDLETEIADWVDDKNAKLLYTSDSSGVEYQFWRFADGFGYRMTTIGNHLMLMRTHNNSKHIESNASIFGPYSAFNVRFMLWVAFGLKILRHNSVAIHTSTIVHDGKAYMFLGESGTGKSTHTSLWRKYIPNSELLNDDSPILRIINGKAWAYGSAWSGKTPCFKDEHYPLGGIVRLSQAPHNAIRRLNKIEALGAILPSCPPAFAYDSHLTDLMCSIISDTIRTVPVYHLDCLPDEDAAQLSYKTLTAKP